MDTFGLNLSLYSFNVTNVAIGAFIAMYFLTYLDQSYKRDGSLWPAFQKMRVWARARDALRGTVESDTKLDSSQQYIFACFPHGAYTLSHILTMTDCCGMLSQVS